MPRFSHPKTVPPATKWPLLNREGGCRKNRSISFSDILIEIGMRDEKGGRGYSQTHTILNPHCRISGDWPGLVAFLNTDGSNVSSATIGKWSEAKVEITSA